VERSLSAKNARLAIGSRGHDQSRSAAPKTAVFFPLANEWDRQEMVQGRITYSRSAKTAQAFRSPYDRSETWEKPVRDADAAATARALPSLELADEWMMQTINRKRSRLLQVSAFERERIEEFVEALFDEDTDRCQVMLAETMAESGDPQKVVELLLEPAARVVGENWCADECDFLKVTLAVSRMQRLFRRMSSEHPPSTYPDLSRCALLTPAPGEQHTFGLSVVDDAFRRAGWEVDCCGCDEEAEMLQLIASNHYLIVGISISVERLLPDLVEISRKLRHRSRNKAIVLIAGGSMVMQNPQGAIDAGFDLLAVDAVSAVALAETVAASLSSDDERQVAAE
jgi:methanogenic corrinoid protein MtbC1